MPAFRSLRHKILWPLLLVTGSLVAAVLWGISHYFYQEMRDDIAQRAELMAGIVRHAAEGTTRPGELQRIVDLLAAERDVLEIVVAGGSPLRVLATNQSVWHDKLLSDIPGEEVADDLREAIRSGAPHNHFNPDDHLFDYSLPLTLTAAGLQGRGAVMVHIDTTRIQKVIHTTTLLFSAGFVAVLGMLVALGYFLLNRQVLQPLATIGARIVAHESGHVDDTAAWAAMRTNDEIGALASRLHEALGHADAAILALEAQKAAVSESEERLRFILETSPTAARISITRGNTFEVIFFNHRYVELLNTTVDKVLGLNPAVYYAQAEVYTDVLQRLGRGEQIFDRLVELHFPGFGTKWTLASYLPIRYQGEPAVLAWFQDITDLERAKTELREQAQHTQAIIDNMVDGVITIDKHGNIQSFNHAAERIFQYRAEDVQGRNVSMLMPEPYRSQHDGYLKAYQATRVAHIIGTGREVEGQRRDGSCFPMELAVSEITRHGAVLYVGMVRDITERKKVERMKTEFVSTVSHELRTPLTAISGALGLITGGAFGTLPDASRQMIDIAHRNSQRLAFLINDLLDMEKLVSGKMRFDLKPQPLGPLINQAIETYQPFGIDRGIRLELTGQVPDAHVHVDSDRLMQVLANLLSNAIKYSPEHGVVHIAVTQQSGLIRVAVSDHGPGIPDEFRNRMFQKFSQADSSDTRKIGGSGLGLAISREIIQRLGGRIDFESVEGNGSNFYFDLPVMNALKSTAGALCPVPADARILVVEDDPDIARTLGLMLEQAGYRVDLAFSGSVALEALRNVTYAAMTLDLHLPDMHGMNLLHAVRGQAATRTLPIVVVSAHISAGKLSINADIANVDWLAKPVDATQLLAALGQQHPIPPGEPLRLLHVEDEIDLAQITSCQLGCRCRYSHAASLREARQAINTQSFDVVLLDVGLPDGSGLELVPDVRALLPQARILVLSAIEVAPDAARTVEVALVKSQTSAEQLLDILDGHLRAAGLGS